MQWHQMTWPEIAEYARSESCAALLPIGATEQHGPHLGCGMDSEIADQLAKAAGDLTDIAVLPTLPYGCSIGHSKRWPGTIALQPKTLIDVVKEIGDWVAYSGIKRLFILNSHVSNFAPLRCALEMLRAEHDDLMVALINSATVSERVKARHFEDADDWHANEAETSLMMALAPEIVRPERLQDSDDPDRTENCVFSHPVNRTSLNGVTGKPSLATVEKGEELFTWMQQDLANKIEQGLKEQPPLPHSYHHPLSDSE
ncbi:creatininase family protein [Thiomicrorhabdus xiamenensis]|uniref:Creatininase family protein n=1 Tax=Thiomicrorhabdus xiamenensis TaxID=2739063 RepID=A0A7D4P3I7_9GAMM|nr:creatininase family protein [Thiomicrorhabdus xiamenensis]QKI88616.1 creatininase family protein [Thiomicrorhabdus xiamenensis]